MSGDRESSNERAALRRLADELVADILAASDEEILSEFQEDFGDPIKYANAMRSRARLLAIGSNKRRLIETREALESDRKKHITHFRDVDLALARKALSNLLSRPPASIPITLAARKEKIAEMSDADVASMVADLEMLGFVVRETQKGDGQKKSSEDQ